MALRPRHFEKDPLRCNSSCFWRRTMKQWTCVLIDANFNLFSANLPTQHWQITVHTWLVATQICFLFSPQIWGGDSQFDWCFSKGLKPPTRYSPCLPCHPQGVLNAPRSPPPPLPPPPPPAPIEVPMEVHIFRGKLIIQMTGWWFQVFCIFTPI